MNERLLKLAFSLDYFSQQNLTPEGQMQVDAELDQQGLPPRKVSRANKTTSDKINYYKNGPVPVGNRLSFAKAHVVRNKWRYGLGAAALGGAALAYNKMYAQPQMPMMEEMPPEQQPQGF